jgi:hypothetical protein
MHVSTLRIAQLTHLDVIPAVMQLSAVLDLYLAAKLFHASRWYHGCGPKHPEAPISVQASPYHQTVARLENIQSQRLRRQGGV